MPNTTPVDKGSKEATFTALAADFEFDDKVRALSGWEDGDFGRPRFYFAEEKEVDVLVAAEKGWTDRH